MQESTYKPASFWLFFFFGLLNSIVITVWLKLLFSHGHNPQAVLQYYLPITIFIAYFSLVFCISYNRLRIYKLLITTLMASVVLSFFIYFNITYVNIYLIVLRIVLMVLAGFTMLFFIQSYHKANYKKPSYSIFFDSVWTTFPLLIATSLFVGLVFFIINTMLGMMYALQMKNVVTFVFANPYFYSFVYPLVFAIGLYLCLSHIKLISNLRYLALSFFKAAFPIFWALSLLFTVLLMIRLFNPQHNSMLDKSQLSMVCFYITTLGIVFINAIYQDNGQSCNKAYRILLNIFVIAMPVLMLIGIINYSYHNQGHFYDQANITVYILATLLFAYSVGYVLKVFSRANWLASLKPTNFYLAWTILILMVIVNINPLMNVLPHAKHATYTTQHTFKRKTAILDNKGCPKLYNLKSNVQQKNRWADAGLIGNNHMAQAICPKACHCAGHWNGQWRTINHMPEGTISVCQCLMSNVK